MSDSTRRLSRRTVVAGALLTPALARVAAAQAPAIKPIRIGVLYDLSGVFAAAGSVAASVGTQIAIDWINEKGGVLGKYKVEAVPADTQSKADVALNEAERLMSQENCDILLGIYSSAHAVPIAPRVDAQKKLLWITVATSIAIVKDRNLQYTFHPQVNTDQYAETTINFFTAEYKKFGVAEVKDLKVAIMHEDGPYGTGIGNRAEELAKQKGMQVVVKEGYSATTPDLSALVTKLRRARPDVIIHVAYNPDITLFFRQAGEGGLKFKALVGQGAGYSQHDKLIESLGNATEYLLNVDPVAGQLLDPAKLAPGMGDMIKLMVDRYKAKTNANEVPPHCSMGFNNTWILLDKVLPVAIQKFGGIDPEAVRKAALELDIPIGGTIQGYGVKFAPPGDPIAGQNVRSFPVVMQYVGKTTQVVFPTEIQSAPPVLPLPKSHPFAA
jgi:branched-chain amino acid transport system substrate-binding protein